MRKWGAFIAIGALLLGLIIYVKVFEAPIERHEEISEATINSIVAEILGEAPVERKWAGDGQFGIDESVLSVEAGETISAVSKPEPFPAKFASLTGELQLALKAGDGQPSDDSVRNVMIRVAIVRGLAVSDDPSEASSYANSMLASTSDYVTTASTLEQLMSAQASRLIALQAFEASIEHDGWDEEVLQSLAASFERTNHRTSLSRILHIRFLKELQAKIIEASTVAIPSKIAASGIFEEPTDGETELIGKLLHRHPRVFSPEDTTRSAAESLRQIKRAMHGPWSQSEKVLDTVAGVQRIWDEYLDVMQMSDNDAVRAIIDLKLKFDTLENPAGIALLHRERTSWSNLVQSAYVADAKEALLKIKLLRLAGREEEANGVLDPLTGESFDLSSGALKSRISGVGEDYSFINAFAEEEQGL